MYALSSMLVQLVYEGFCFRCSLLTIIAQSWAQRETRESRIAHAKDLPRRSILELHRRETTVGCSVGRYRSFTTMGISPSRRTFAFYGTAWASRETRELFVRWKVGPTKVAPRVFYRRDNSVPRHRDGETRVPEVNVNTFGRSEGEKVALP